ncbi:MAG: class I SAM-dependent methyltransferase, partial [Mariprofundaceae bacterium]
MAQESFSRYQLRYLKCVHCGLYFSSVPADQLDTYLNYAETFSSEWRGEGRKEVFTEVLSQVKGEPCGKLLDVGCGGGLMLVLAKDHGWNVYGVEPGMGEDAWAFEDVRMRISHTIAEAGGEAEFDAVTAVNVIDQVAEPWVLLRQSAQKLKADGMLVIRIPNFTVQFILHKLAVLLPKKLGSRLLSSVVMHEFGLGRKA